MAALVGFCALIVSWVITILGMLLIWRGHKYGIGIDLRQIHAPNIDSNSGRVDFGLCSHRGPSRSVSVSPVRSPHSVLSRQCLWLKQSVKTVIVSMATILESDHIF